MGLQGAFLGVLILISVHFWSVSVGETNVCKTYGSGIIQTFSGNMLYLKTTCPFTLTRFTLLGVNCDVTVQRGPNGLMNRVQILVNKVTTILQNGNVTVEGNSVSLPFDHTYQLVYQYGIYIKLRSKVLPFSVIWRNHSEGVSSLWVQLDQGIMDGMTGICGLKTPDTTAQLTNIISDGQCVTVDSKAQRTEVCQILSYAVNCGKPQTTWVDLCSRNMFSNINMYAKCSFFEEVAYQCGNQSKMWSIWRQQTSCTPPVCPGDLKFQELGSAFPPTCNDPQPRSEAFTRTCLPPSGTVLNDRADGYHAVNVKSCPCVYMGMKYPPGTERNSKCQSCICTQGKWACSPNVCPPTCNIEGQFVTTFDGKQYSVPGKCTYVAARGSNWNVGIKFSDTDASIAQMYLDVYQERYTFSVNSVKLGEDEITDLSQTDYTTVFWQSSMFIQVQTSFGMKIKVQISPEIQMYLYLPPTENTKGLCGTYNNDTGDDFTTSSGIVENAVQPFAQSWTLTDCSPTDSPVCINTNNGIFAEDKCSQLRNTSSLFARCHAYVSVNTFFDACVQRTCQCTSGLQNCLCVALSNYAKACAIQGIDVGDWRAETACNVACNGNLIFSYSRHACNQTCRSLMAPDPTCMIMVDPVEGCGCLPGTHLNTPLACTPSALCACHYSGGTIPPGPATIDGRQCMCENGKLNCSAVCDCPRGKVCVHCAQGTVSTSQKTCESLSKPFSVYDNCTTGCYCPPGMFEDHNGNCVTQENCTCEFSGSVYATGQGVETHCKTCICRGGQWNCEGEPCPGVCEVFGNGQYNTFDSKWFHFDGNCRYTLVEDARGNDHGLFAVSVESVPCCDEVLTCSRAISLDLQDDISLTLRDMNVTEILKADSHLRAQPLYSVHTVGLNIIITVPALGLTLVWDKHTRVKIILQGKWKGNVRGLCGNFDGKVMNDLLTSSSSVVFSTLEFGNSWRTAVPPCSDVTQEVFPCERHSYCEAWAQRRCMILHSDTFAECHLKVDPVPYYQACVLESCSCEFEGRFLGFCTAVSAYADACATQNACINWRTPDMCPVYCDYYNEESENGWHYEPCGQIKTCGKINQFTGRLEGCYPKCPAEIPYFDENTRRCTSLDKCTCYFNNTVVSPGDNVTTFSDCCECRGGQLICGNCATTTPSTKVATVHPMPSFPQYSSGTTTKTTNLKPDTSAETTTTTSVIPTPQTTMTMTSTNKIPETTLTEATAPPETTLTEASTPPGTTLTEASTPPGTTLTEASTPPGTTLTEATAPPETTVTEASTPPETTVTEASTPPGTTLTEASTPPGTTLTEATTTAKTTFTEATAPPETTLAEASTPPGTTLTEASTPPGTTLAEASTPPGTTLTEASTPPETTFTEATIPPETTLTEATTPPETTVTEATTTAETTVTEATAPPGTALTEATTPPGTTLTEATAPPETTVTEATTPPETTVTEATAPPETTLTEATTPPETTVTEATAPPGTALTEATTPPGTALTEATTPPETTLTEATTPPETTLTEASTPPGTTLTEATTPPETTLTEASTPPETTLTEATAPPETTLTEATTPPETTLTEATTPPETTLTEATAPPETTLTEATAPPETTVTEATAPPETTVTEATAPPGTALTEATTPPGTTVTEATTPPGTTVTEATAPPGTTVTEATAPPGTTVTEATAPPGTALTEATTPPGTALTEATTPPGTTVTEATTPPGTTVTEATAPPGATVTEATAPPGTTVTEATAPPGKTVTEATTSPETTVTEATAPPGTTLTEATTSPETTVTIIIAETPTKKSGSTTLLTTTTTEFPHVITNPPPSITSLSQKSLVPTNSVRSTQSTTAGFCRDPLRNQSWSNGAEWKEDCFYKSCRNSIIEMKPVVCPTLVQPVCREDLLRLVRDEQGCCEIWQCDCQCELYGDPHYVSFSGTKFDFLDNCTYTLVKEKIPHHQLSIAVDNYYSTPLLFGSSVKGIILKYRNDIVTLQLNVDNYTVEAAMNQIPVQPPYEENGIRFEGTNYKIFVYMDEIRSYVSFDPDNTLQITLAMEKFKHNTLGQCGVCGGASCVRNNGQIESDDCCNVTAYDWIEENPLKPFCTDAPRNVPCKPINPTPGPTTPPCEAPLCELLRHEVFHECNQNVDVETLVTNCRFDYCVAMSNSSICSPLQHLSEQCKRMGFCVYWRNLTEGACDVTCPEGMVFDECRSTPNDVCQGRMRVPAKLNTDTMRSGCFCPENQSLAEEHKTICVSDCTNCKGPLGEPMMAGAVWESNCHICKCNNQTLTEDCLPMPPAPTPVCSADSTLISDCCNNQICVEKTCEYNGKTYKVGDSWGDLSERCVSFSCTSAGTEIQRSVCPEQSCSEEFRVWDEHHCCYSCNVTCAVRMSKMTVKVEGCTQEVNLPSCEGYCPSNTMTVQSGVVLQLGQERRCCREKSYELKRLSLSCDGSTPAHYTYNHVTSCECQPDA